jgi:hypothetical protein
MVVADIGKWAAGQIFHLAESLAAEHVPGLVSLGFLLTLAGCSLAFGIGTFRSRKVLRASVRAIRTTKDEREFRAQPALVRQAFDTIRNDYGPTGVVVAEAWDEYRETVMTPDDADDHLRNGLRPSLFFNLEDLGMAPGFWRILPGLFVSCGLALTFLGLIAVLHGFSATMISAESDPALTMSSAIQGGMTVFIATASAKFIMSLTGLFCSIIFTIGLRLGTSFLEKDLRDLCREIEKRLTFVSLEELATGQLNAIRKQTEQMKTLNAELVEGLARPLREEIPAAISKAISDEMRPLIATIGQSTSSGLETMVGDLSTRFSRDVGDALAAASTRLSEAGDKLLHLSGTMESGSGRMGAEFKASIASLSDAMGQMQSTMKSSADQTAGAFTQGAGEFLAAMNGSLDQIRANTEQSNTRLGEVAEALISAAGRFREEVDGAGADARRNAAETMDASARNAAEAVNQAGASVLHSFDAAIAATAERAAALSGKAGEDLLKPLEDLRARLDEIVTRAAAGASHVSNFADGAQRSAAAVGEAAKELNASADAFRSAAAPLRLVAERSEAAATLSAKASEAAAAAVTRSAEEVAHNASRALKAAAEVADARTQVTSDALRGIEAALKRFQDVADRYDELDENLGEAFETFRVKVNEVIGAVAGSAKEVHGNYADALDTLRELVDQAQAFRPQQRTT